MTSISNFICERKSNHPIPSGDVGRIKLLAKELALGVHQNLWSRRLSLNDQILENDLHEFLENRWNEHKDFSRILEPLRGHGYVERDSDSSNGRYFRLSRMAFDLLLQAEPYNVFVSYKHSESSALALLLVTIMNSYGLNAYCDMALKPGEHWHPELRQRIEECKFFVVLVGKQTHRSGPTVREIQHAYNNDRTIIPIWHNKYRHKSEKWVFEEYPDVVSVIHRTHAVIVRNESAGGYNAAITELLANRFGITP